MSRTLEILDFLQLKNFYISIDTSIYLSFPLPFQYDDCISCSVQVILCLNCLSVHLSSWFYLGFDQQLGSVYVNKQKPRGGGLKGSADALGEGDFVPHPHPIAQWTWLWTSLHQHLSIEKVQSNLTKFYPAIRALSLIKTVESSRFVPQNIYTIE